MCSFPRLLTSAVWNCWRTKILFLHLLFGLFATCIFSLIWVTVYFKHSPPTCLFLPITILSPSPSLLRRHLRNPVPNMTPDEDIPPNVKAIVQLCLVCPPLQSEAVHSSCSISASAVEGCLSQQFTHCHKWQIHCSSPSSVLLSCLHLLTVNKTNVHFSISRDLQLFSLVFAPTGMHRGPSKPSHLTRLLHVSYDPVEGHFRPHVACVVDRLPAGLQWKAHLCQLHYCRLIYFWSCEWDKHGINNRTVAAADSTQSGACRWKPNKILCWRFL